MLERSIWKVTQSCLVAAWGWGRVTLMALALVSACSDDGDDSFGEFECRGSECVCPSSGDCRIHCHGDCDLQCAGSGACDFICDEDCAIACTGSGPCVASVADKGAVECPGSGGCVVNCDGDCSIECPGSGDCRVHCEPEFTCSIERCDGEVVDCGDGIQVCNGSCPS